MNTVVICPSGVVSQVLARLALPGPEGAGTTTVVSSKAADVRPEAGLQVLTMGRPLGKAAERATRALSGSVVGRNILRLTPWDGGRRLARAARRDTRVRAACSGADLIVAVERDGILTAWTAARRWAEPSASVVYGVAAADALLRQARA